MAETLFEELKRYVGFGSAEETALRALSPVAAPSFTRIADVFYQRILEHEGARKALQGGESQIGHLKVTLVAWLEKLLQGPWDEAYFELRCRIGRVHVRIALPQHYMFGAMNVVRGELTGIVDQHCVNRPDELRATRLAVGKLLDLELAIMLHTYREDLLTQQARSERLSTFGQLVGSIGHELRNPLGVIETSLFILKGRIGDDERGRKHVERIGEQVGISNQIISDLLDMIRDRPLSKEKVQLAEAVDSAMTAVVHPPEVGLRVEGISSLAPVHGDRGQLRQAFLNLIDNAVHAASPKGEVRILGGQLDGFVRVAVEDTGPGVDASIRQRLFEPLITTKEKGIGLGLALVKRIAERHDGSITYESTASGGARFVLRIPVAR
jgi:two-component system, NtrC family, sensor histidine kinase HydH